MKTIDKTADAKLEAIAAAEKLEVIKFQILSLLDEALEAIPSGRVKNAAHTGWINIAKTAISSNVFTSAGTCDRTIEELKSFED